MTNSLAQVYAELGITEIHLKSNRLSRSEEPPFDMLEVLEIDFEGRPFILARSAAKSWKEMYEKAQQDRVSIEPFSGFRSYLYQKQLIKRKLERGKALEAILKETAIPGFSEHHTGRAVDICTEGKYLVEESFENSKAFDWLMKNAEEFNFYLSYPRNNEKGIVYEPWHWCFLDKI